MGLFHSTDKLGELKKRFLEPDKHLYEILIYEIVDNMSHLISPKHKDKIKTTRIENAAKIMFNTICDIIEYIELDETDLDDVMILNDQIDLKIKIIHRPHMSTTEWIELWDKTQDNLSKLCNILCETYITYSHQRYYRTMLNIKKTVRIMYRKRDLYSPKKS